MTCGTHFAAAVSTFPKAARDQKKKEVASGQNNPRKERFQLGWIWPSGPTNYPARPFVSYNFSPLQNMKVLFFDKKHESPMFRKNKKQGDSTYKFVYVKIKI
jgi:hypothetical protein